MRRCALWSPLWFIIIFIDQMKTTVHYRTRMGFVRDRTYSDAQLVIEYNDYEVSTSTIRRTYDCCIGIPIR